MNINTFLVKKLQLSHQQIKHAIDNGFVYIDERIATQKQKVVETNSIFYKSKIIQQGKVLFYLAFNKPVGVESTLNTAIEHNLVAATQLDTYFFPIGRLDKASAGLLILTNDGALYKEILDDKNRIEKCYEVSVDKEIDAQFIRKMAEGIEIMGVRTKPCKVTQLTKTKFEIVLVEGRNRQIRRMCYKLGYEVLSLVRTQIGNLHLNSLQQEKLKTVKRSDII